MSAKSAYNTSKVTSGELVDSLLGGIALNYVSHRICLRRASRKGQKHVEMVDLDRQKELACVQDRNLLHRETRNGAWLLRLNGT